MKPVNIQENELVSEEQLKLVNSLAQLQDKMTIIKKIKTLFTIYEKYIFEMAYEFSIERSGIQIPIKDRQILDALERELTYLTPMIPKLNIDSELNTYFSYFSTGKFKKKRVYFQKLRRKILNKIDKSIKKLNKLPFHSKVRLGGTEIYKNLLTFLDYNTETIRKYRQLKTEYDSLFSERKSP